VGKRRISDLMMLIASFCCTVNSPEAKLAWENKKKLDFKKEHLKEWEVMD
jgi:hypothetical protein